MLIDILVFFFFLDTPLDEIIQGVLKSFDIVRYVELSQILTIFDGKNLNPVKCLNAFPYSVNCTSMPEKKKKIIHSCFYTRG